MKKALEEERIRQSEEQRTGGKIWRMTKGGRMVKWKDMNLGKNVAKWGKKCGRIRENGERREVR